MTMVMPELVADLHQPRHQVLDDDGREAKREFVDQQQLRLGHQAGRERQHLPLAAGQQSADARAQVGEAREERIDLLLAPAAFGFG
jgi:hypothetical protein